MMLLLQLLQLLPSSCALGHMHKRLMELQLLLHLLWLLSLQQHMLLLCIWQLMWLQSLRRLLLPLLLLLLQIVQLLRQLPLHMRRLLPLLAIRW
jgi:hypothetical protein